MNKLNNLPLNDVANNSNTLLLELTNTAKELQSVSQHLQEVLSSVENEKVSQQIVQTLNDFSMLAKDFSAGSKSHQELQEMMSALTKAMHELKPLLNQMHKQPNSLIFNPGKAEALEPKKYNGVKQ
jgi:paraquat-inducible protein B